MGTSTRMGFVVLAVAGLVALAVGGVRTASALGRADGLVARGTVVSHTDRSASELSSAYRPVVRFRTRDGESVTFTSGVREDSRDTRVGAKVDVRYDPDAPEDATIDSFEQTWLTPIGLLVVGFALLIVAFALPRVLGFGPLTARSPTPDWWRAHGTRVEGRLIAVREIPGSGGARQAHVRAEHPPGTSLEFASHPFRAAATMPDLPEGTEVPVYLAPDRPRLSFVDIQSAVDAHRGPATRP